MRLSDRPMAFATRLAPATLLVIGVAVLIVVFSSASTASRLHKEGTESAALARMAAALDGVSASYAAAPEEPRSDANVDIDGFVADFDEAWEELAALIDADERDEVEQLAMRFDAYLDAASEPATSGRSAEDLERGLRETLFSIQLAENVHLVESLDRLDRAEDLLRVAVPVLLLVAVVVSVLVSTLLKRTQRLERIEGVTKAKDELIATVSHELRTPLTAVMGAAYELRDRIAGSGSTDLETLAEMVTGGSEELTALVDDLLVAARADASSLPVSVESLGVAQQIERVLATCPAAGTTVTVEEGMRVLADPVRFRQILRNLIENACRHGGPQLRVEARAGQNGHGHVRILDDGDGVPAELLEEVFAAYRRGHSSNDGGSRFGLGLGLNVSKKLAERMQGDLIYQREQGWTVFELVLPSVVTPTVAVARPR